MLKSILFATALALSVLAAGGCPISRNTTAELVNDTGADLHVRVFYDSEQNIPEDLIDDAGREAEFDLAPGETRTFSRDCDELQAIVVKGELNLIGNFGPEETTRIFRDGDDFGCGDVLVFRFTQNALGTDLEISVTLP